MDSFEWNKLAAGALLALIVIMVGSIVADELVHPPKIEKNAYPIEVTEEKSSGSAEPEKVALEPIEPLLAKADAENGKKLVQVCTTCHSFEKSQPSKVGPNLYNTVGNKLAHFEGFAYSQAMTSHGGKWTYDNLNHFLSAPREFLPGTKMSFAGVKKTKDRADIIAYLRTLSETPQPLP